MYKPCGWSCCCFQSIWRFASWHWLPVDHCSSCQVISQLNWSTAVLIQLSLFTSY